jgi:hypothetical protein
MNQGEVWKKRSTGLTGEFRGNDTNWLCSKDRDRDRNVATPAGSARKAGVKLRRY